MASVTYQKRPNGRIGVRLNLDGGGTRWLGTFDRKRDAKAAGDRARVEYQDGRVPGRRRLTLKRYWLDTLQPLFVDGNEELSEGTREAKRMIFATYVLSDRLALLPLHHVTEEEVRRF